MQGCEWIKKKNMLHPLIHFIYSLVLISGKSMITSDYPVTDHKT